MRLTLVPPALLEAQRAWHEMDWAKQHIQDMHIQAHTADLCEPSILVTHCQFTITPLLRTREVGDGLQYGTRCTRWLNPSFLASRSWVQRYFWGVPANRTKQDLVASNRRRAGHFGRTKAWHLRARVLRTLCFHSCKGRRLHPEQILLILQLWRSKESDKLWGDYIGLGNVEPSRLHAD